MDLNLVAMFVAVAERASFSAAARALGVPTSTASRAVARLEDTLGVALFRRTTRHVGLTAEGEALLARCAPALTELETSLATATETDEPSGVLRLTAPPDLGAALLAGAVARFTQRYPRIKVEVVLSSRMFDLIVDGFDAALRGTIGRLADSSLVARKLAPIESHIYASPDYLRRRPAPKHPRDVASHSWVEFRGWKHPRELAMPASRIVCDDFDFLRQVLCAGAGLGFLPRLRAEPDVAAGALVRVLPHVCRAGGHIVLLHAKHPAKKVIAFRELLVEELGVAP